MDEYISREALLAELAADYGNWISCNDTDESYLKGVRDNYADTIRLVNEITAADVQPVKRGRWINNTYTQVFPWKCEKCNYDSPARFNYCPNCGSRMAGDSE